MTGLIISLMKLNI